MAKYTKLLQFSVEAKRNIIKRDNYSCLFCRMKYRMPTEYKSDLYIYDIMHYINKSNMGLGIEQNGILGCRYHHHMLDNGNKGYRPEMLEIMKQYLMDAYPEWNEKDLRYDK